MSDSQIFKATYSSVPVYEMLCKSVAVMRRRSDSWLNATQILKVAGLDKPQRTRMLEREVQTGEHEKVQGGYGKYQGTWVPLHRGLALARQCNIETLLRPIIDFRPASKSPPLAPKHVSIPNMKPKRKDLGPDFQPPAIVMSTRGGLYGATSADSPGHSDSPSRASEDGTMSPALSAESTPDRTPSPVGSNYESDELTTSGAPPHKRRARREPHEDEPQRKTAKLEDKEATPHSYAEEILRYFITDTNTVPSFLVSPPRDFDPNVVLDDEGHTALHWACAMGRIRIVKLLLSAGADILKTNKVGQTALMRSVMFANNYDVRKFPELYELLRPSTLHVDLLNRTVFHHIIDVALSKGKTHAARYYLDTLLQRLSDNPPHLADVLNWGDDEGETTLTMAARSRNKRLVKALLDNGADPKLVNKDGKSAEAYIHEDERFRSSPKLPDRTHAVTYRISQAAASPNPFSTHPKIPLYHSAAAQSASQHLINRIAAKIGEAAESHESELMDVERKNEHAAKTFRTFQAELRDSQGALAALPGQTVNLDDANETVSRLEAELVAKMGQRCRVGWEEWIRADEEREARVRANGALDGATPEAPPNEEAAAVAELYRDIPDDDDALRTACAALRASIVAQRERRAETFAEFAKAQAACGTSHRLAELRRLVATGCGGIPLSDVDAALPMLLESLGYEDALSYYPS